MLIAIQEIQDGPCVFNTDTIDTICYDEVEECYRIETPGYSYNITKEQFEQIIATDLVMDLRPRAISWEEPSKSDLDKLLDVAIEQSGYGIR